MDLEGFCEVDDLDKTFRQKFRTGILSALLCGYRANERLEKGNVLAGRPITFGGDQMMKPTSNNSGQKCIGMKCNQSDTFI